MDGADVGRCSRNGHTIRIARRHFACEGESLERAFNSRFRFKPARVEQLCADTALLPTWQVGVSAHRRADVVGVVSAWTTFATGVVVDMQIVVGIDQRSLLQHASHSRIDRFNYSRGWIVGARCKHGQTDCADARDSRNARR